MTSIDDVMIEITPQMLLRAYALRASSPWQRARTTRLYWIEPERPRDPAARRDVTCRDGWRARFAPGRFEVGSTSDFEG